MSSQLRSRSRASSVTNTPVVKVSMVVAISRSPEVETSKRSKVPGRRVIERCTPSREIEPIKDPSFPPHSL